MPKTSYTRAITREQADKLRSVLEEGGFAFAEKPYTIFAASRDKLSVAVFEKGPKVLVQGKDTEQFVEFTLEPEVLGVAELGYEEVNHPEMFEPHFGIDESGKGDFFGPLVVAGAYVDAGIARALMEAGIQDSKRIGSDKKIIELAEVIRETPGIRHHIIVLKPAKYNELYAKFKNLNRMLAWCHAAVIEDLAKQRPDCPRALSDQFANPKVLERALEGKAPGVAIQQRTKAESDIAVAAASILARERFVAWTHAASKELGFEVPKGASAAVKKAAARLVAERGEDFLPKAAKMHFRTAYEVLGLPVPEKKPWRASKPD